MIVGASLLLISPFVFGVLGVLAAVNFARQPDGIRRDAALMLNSLAISLILSTFVFPRSARNEFLEILTTALLVAHPYLLVRLVHHFRPVSRWILQSALVAWLLCMLLLIVREPRAAPFAGIFMVVYAVFYEGVAMVALLRGANAAFGMTRLRLLLAAVGSGLLGGIALVIGFMPILPSLAPVLGLLIEIILAGSAICYYLAFAFPAWLRNIWQSQVLYTFLKATTHQSSEIEPTGIYAALVAFSLRFFGGTAAWVATWDDVTHELQLVYGQGAALSGIKFERGPLITVLYEQRPQQITYKAALDAAHHALLSKLQARILFAVPITSLLLPHGILLISVQLSSLFEASELNLLALFAQQSGLLLDDFTHRNQIIEEELRQRTLSIRLLQNIALAANEATSIEQAFHNILDRIATAMGAQTGHIFVQVEGDPDTFVSSRVWYLDDVEQFQSFREATEVCQVVRGTALIGQILETGTYQQIDANVAAQMVPARAAATEACGLTAAFLFPIWIRDSVVGVAEFFFVNPPRLPAELLDVIRNIGEQLGRAIERKQNEKSLQQSEWWFRVSFEQAGMGLAHISQEGHWLRVNQKLCDLLGYTREEMLERTWQSLTHPDDLDTDQQQSVRLQSGEIEAYSLEKRFIRKDGSLLWVSLTNSLARDPAGKVAYGIKVLVDITKRKYAEAALNESDARIGALLNMAVDAIISVDDQRRIIVFNRGAELIFGHKAEEMLGRLWFDLVSPRLIEYLKTLAVSPDELLWSEQSREIVALHQSGREFPAEMSISKIPQGDQFIYTVIVRDISERKQIEKTLAEERNLLRIVIDNIPVSVYVKDTERRFLVANPYLVAALGKTDSRDVLGKTDSEFLPPDQVRGFAADEEKLLHTGEAIIEKDEMMSTPLGGDHYIVTTKLPLLNAEGQITGLIGMHYDVTDRRRSLEEIQRMNQELEKRVAERTMHLEAANQELEAFTYTVSHDLRSPLRAIHGFSRHVLDHFPEQLPPTALHYIQRIYANSETMGQLIDTLLALARLDRQYLSRTIVSPSEIVHEALETVLVDERSSTPTITIADLPVCYADSMLLRQVFINLLSNAVKFTRYCEHAEIEVNAYRADTGNIVYYVKDNGVGFNMAFVDKLFGVFQRLHDDDEFEGNGAGLSIVKRIVTRHGGTIWAEAEVNKGASFFFTLEARGSGGGTKSGYSAG